MPETAACALPTTFVQSPSIEDLLSARSKRCLAGQSVYSALSMSTDIIDLPEAARLAMQHESENGVWSPAMTSSDDGTECQHTTASPKPGLVEGLATPAMSESQYSPSLANVAWGADDDKENALPAKSHSNAPESPSKRVLNARNLVINTALSAAHPYPTQSTTPAMPSARSAQIEVPSVPPTARSLPEIAPPASSTSVLPAAPLTAIPPHINRPRRRSSLDSFASSAAASMHEEDDPTMTLNQASLQRMQSFLGPKMRHVSPAPWSDDQNSSLSLGGLEGSSIDGISVYTSSSSFWTDDDPEIGSVQQATKTPRSRSVKEALGVARAELHSGSSATSALKGLGLALAAAAAAAANTATASPPPGSSSSSTTARPSMSSERSTKSRTTTASSDTMSVLGKVTMQSSRKGKGSAPPLPRSESRGDIVSSSPPPAVPAHTTMVVTNIVRSRTPEPPRSAGLPATTSDSLVTSTDSAGAGDSLTRRRSLSVLELREKEAEPATSTASEARPDTLPNLVTSKNDQALAQMPATATPISTEGLARADSPASTLSSSIGSTKQPASNGRRPTVVSRKRPPVYHQDSAASIDSVGTLASQSTATTVARTASSTGTGTPSTSMSSLPSPNYDQSEVADKANVPNMKLIPLDLARERERDRIVVASQGRSPAGAPPVPHQPLSAKPVAAPYPAPAMPLPPVPTYPAKAIKTKKSGFLKLFKPREDLPVAMPGRPAVEGDIVPQSVPIVAGGRSVSSPMDLRRGEGMLVAGGSDATARTAAVRTEPSSALPFPVSKANGTGASASVLSSSAGAGGIEMSEATRRANASAPAAMSLLQAGQTVISVRPPVAPGITTAGPDIGTGGSKAKRQFAQAQNAAGLAPSLSLRPVSMMFSSMPQAFLADLEAAETRKQHLRADAADAALPSPGPARTPDTPSFVFFDPDNIVTPPGSGASGSLPALDAAASAASGTASATATTFGLPTPPHSASSARTFVGQPPLSPSLLQKQQRHLTLESNSEATAAAAYRARIVQLENQLRSLSIQLHAARDGREAEQLPIVEDAETQRSGSPTPVCDRCGCSCRSGRNDSILARPRMVGHGNMFSSGRG